MAAESIFSFLPPALQSPTVYAVTGAIFLLIILFALLKKRSLSISIFGKNIIDVKEKAMEGDTGITEKPKTPLKDDTSAIRKLKGEYVPKHVGCDHVNDFILVITETTNVVSEISEIKYKGCISEQMTRADQHLSRIRAILQTAYRDKLSELNDPTVDTVGAYKFYQSLTYIMAADVKDQVIRSSFLYNHLADFADEDAYSAYTDKQFENVKNVMSDILSDMYFGDYALHQNEVIKLHEEKNSDVKKIVKDIYIDARDIAKKKKARIEELQKGLKEFVKKIVGING